MKWYATRELAVCIRLNRICRFRPVRNLFALVSWLGDGKLWYSVMLILPILYGTTGLIASLNMALVGVVGLAVYKLIKNQIQRLRPFVMHSNINLGTSPLDQYSFPSGHTMHAVAFTIVAVHYIPEAIWLLAPVTALIALSRVILGLHYPSDVAFGAFIGSFLALVSVSI